MYCTFRLDAAVVLPKCPDALTASAPIWFPVAWAAAPAPATGNQIGAEAVKASGHFGNTTAASNRNVQYIVLSPPSTHPDGFNTTGSQFCAWHDYTGDTSLSGTEPNSLSLIHISEPTR